MCKKLLCFVFAILLMGLVENAPAELLLHYGFDETSGTTATDSTGGNDGAVSGGTWATPGAKPQTDPGHLVLSAGSITVSNPPSSIGDLTIMLWLNKTGGPRFPWLVGTIGGGAKLQICIEEDGNPGQVEVGCGGGWEIATTGFSSGSWVHLAFVREAASGAVKMYLDGNLEHTFSCGAANIDLSTLMIGKSPAWSERYLNGGYDDFAILDEALDEGTINSCMTNGVDVLLAPEIEFDSAASGDLESVTPAELVVVVKNAKQGQTYTVDYAATGGTATAGQDYTIAGGGPACWGSATQCHGDTDDDGEVKGSDFLALKNSWYKSDPDPDYNPCADFDRDGEVKGSDFLILKNNWYQAVEANCPSEGGSATLEFAPGETSKTISIEIINDGLDEEDETIIVELLNPAGSNVVLGEPNQHVYTIEDPRPEVSFEKDSSKDREEISPAEITACLSFASTELVTVDYCVTGGTATGGGVDYTLVCGTLTFNPGELCKTISIAVVDDGVDEYNETIAITLSNSANAKVGAITEHTYTIIDPSQLHLKVDLALPMWGTRDPWPGTAKEGWWHFIAGRWADMYAHDCVWECDGQCPDGIAGTGVHAMLSCGYEGQAGLHAKDLCRCNLAGDCPPSGTIQGDPIANTWLYAVDWASPPGGDTVLIITDLPAGTYDLKSYHNHWEPGPGQGSRNCCRCQQPMPPLPSVTAQSLPSSGKPPGKDGYRGLCLLGDDGGVTAIENDYDVPVTYVYNDDEVSTSLIKFHTDGRPVLVIYEAPDWGFPDCARPGREGGRGILNAFELKLVGP